MGPRLASLRTGITATIVGAMIWFAFIVLFLAFYAGGLDFWQKAAVFLASAAIVGGAIGVYWARWALRD